MAELAGYRERRHVERSFAWIGTFRHALVRYERQASVYQALVTFVAALIGLRRSLSE